MKNIFAGFILTLSTLTMYAGIVDVTKKEELDDLLKNHEKVVAEFYSPTCVHCINFEKSGVFQQLSQELPGVAFAKISYKTGRSLFNQYGVSSFPTFIIFKNGKSVEKRSGTLAKATLKSLI